MSQRKFITDENLKRFASNVKKDIVTLHENVDADLGNIGESVKTAQSTADAARSAAATAQSTANSKLSSVKTINNVSLVGTGNLRLADLGIDTDIFIVCTELPKLADAKYGKVYLVKNSNIDPTGADTYVEYVKISDESQSPAVDKWEKLGEWKPSVTVDSALSTTSTNPVQNKVVNTALANKVDKVSGKQLSTNDYTTAEKNKLAGIADGATKVVVDAALSSTSANAIQNKAVNTALAGKVDKVSGKQLSTNDYTTAEKNKLAGIADGATKVVVDTALSSTSANAIQNRVVNENFEALNTKIGTETAKCVKNDDIVTLTNDDIDTLWSQATAL